MTKNQTYTGLGKLPPQAIDAEDIILGAILLVKNIPMNVWNTLQPEFFYKSNNQYVFKAVQELRSEKKAIDIITVTARLRQLGYLEQVGGAYAITELTNRVASSANIEEHLLIVHQMFLKRELIRLGTECINDMYEDGGDPFDAIKAIIHRIAELEKGIFKKTEKSADTLVYEAIEEMNRPKPKGLLGISTGLRGIDKITLGDQKGQVRVIAARPAMGKTAYMCSEMLSCVYDKKTDKFLPFEQQTAVGCFSLEMRGVQLTFRMLSNLTDIDNSKIKKNELNETEQIRFHRYAEQYAQSRIYIDDTPGLHIDEFEMKCAMWVALYDVKKIYIDYLQLMKGERGKRYGNRENELSDITRRIKTVASELDITIIELAQLSREVEKRKLCKPILSDLRESGSIEQDADIVQFLWRPEYYPEAMIELTRPDQFILINPYNLKINEYQGLLIAIIAKCREEEAGYIPLRFKGAIMRVSDHPLFLDVLDTQNLFDTNERDAPF